MAKFVFDELRREFEELHRQLDALRDRVTRMFALSGVLLVVVAGLGERAEPRWAALLFVPAGVTVVAFGLVWREDRKPRAGGPVASEVNAASPHNARLTMIPRYRAANAQNAQLRTTRRRALRRAENLLALAMILVVVWALVVSPVTD